MKSIFSSANFIKYKNIGDSSDKINYSAFIAAAMDRKRIINRDLLWEVFKNFDTDQNEYISIFSVEKAIDRTGKKKSFDEIASMFKEIGLSVDAQIDFESFCQIIENDI